MGREEVWEEEGGKIHIITPLLLLHRPQVFHSCVDGNPHPPVSGRAVISVPPSDTELHDPVSHHDDQRGYPHL